MLVLSVGHDSEFYFQSSALAFLTFLKKFVNSTITAQTVLGVYLKRTFSRDTSASSALLVVIDDHVLYKSTHSLAHSSVVRRIR